VTAETYERLKKIVVEQLGVDEDQVTPEASFVDDLNADSLDLVELIISLEEEFTKDGKVVEIRQPQLASYSDLFFGLTDDKTGVRFRAWHGGDTTQNSRNPRSELREMNADGSDEYNWSFKSGRHSMEVVGQVNRLTRVKPHVVIAQIHGADDDLTVFRVEGAKLYLTKGDDTHAYLLDPNFQLGKRYTLRFDVVDGKCSYTYNGVKPSFTVSSSDTSAYFKTGNYLQSNPTTAPSESTSEYSEVVVYSVTVTHS